MTDFNPPIKDRETDELLEIIGASEKWDFDIVKLAEAELNKRKIDKTKIETAKYLSKKKDKLKKTGKSNESLLSDFIEEPFWTIVVILFSWELRKDGFERKAKEQRILRMIILGLIIISGLIFISG